MQTREQITAELNKLNKAQRSSLRARFSTLKLVDLKTEEFLGYVDTVIPTFEVAGDLIQYRVSIGPRGALRSVTCAGKVMTR